MHELPQYDPREDELRDFGLSLPETTEDFPWGHRTLKVRGKAFVFMSADADGFGMSMKLPTSKDEALALPGATPTGYGLGKAGWVSLRFPLDVDPPMAQLRAWLVESYKAVAPKRLGAKV